MNCDDHKFECKTCGFPEPKPQIINKPIATIIQWLGELQSAYPDATITIENFSAHAGYCTFLYKGERDGK